MCNIGCILIYTQIHQIMQLNTCQPLQYYAVQKILAVIVSIQKKKICNPYFIVIMITVLIMNVIFWVVNFKTQNYFVISTTQNVYLR
jgi:MFS superfamily sulfate permease-like transporter